MGTKASQKAKTGAKKPKVTMMDQFQKAKKEQPDALLFFRMGDFYELFGKDAEVAARELGISLTSRSKGAEAMPMAGVPVKSMEGHLLRLVRKGPQGRHLRADLGSAHQQGHRRPRHRARGDRWAPSPRRTPWTPPPTTTWRASSPWATS